MHPKPMIATYRVQLTKGFGFSDLIKQLDYLRELGISHVYVSPILQAAPDSAHCYDVVDCTRVNEQLGGEEAFRTLSRELEARGMGLMLDIVPNHMSIDTADNVWWYDVLENGPSSLYARFFDIEWHSGEAGDGKVLAPILSDHYGRVLEKGGIHLEHDGGKFSIRCSERRMPVAPEAIGGLLREACGRQWSDELDFAGRSLQGLSAPKGDERGQMERRDRDKRLLYRMAKGLLADQGLHAAVDEIVAAVNANQERLDELLRAQHYRLAFWRVAAQQLGYRRFFDVNTLLALRADAPEVFAATHETLLRLYRVGCFDSLRVDHIDGIRNPVDYLEKLRAAVPEAHIVVEKILEPDEQLPSNWPVDGTTGYDFLFAAGNLFIDQSAEDAITQLYWKVTGDRRPFHLTAKASKQYVLRELFGSDVRRLLALFQEICDKHPRHRDYLRSELEEALELFITALPVYRTYIEAGSKICSNVDRQYVEQAIERAKGWAPDLDPELFNFLRDLVLLGAEEYPEVDFVMRLQQLMGPATAKGIEDTAFYRYQRLVALNEVGGDPDRFGIGLDDFHARAEQRRSSIPLSLLATSTHDSKRSEDVRIRICGLTEMPERWSEVVKNWFHGNERFRSNEHPDPKTEYLFYQTVVGAWPLDPERGSAYMLKAAREAKEYTSWTRPVEGYERALSSFVEATLGDEQFRGEAEHFVRELQEPARVGSLAQTLIKLTALGVPDLYQGTELWRLYLVDPDNRCSVDYQLRNHLLHELDGLSCAQILERADEGLPKLWLIRESLAVRRQLLSCFSPNGTYRPLAAEGERADCLVAYERGGHVVVLAPRLPRRVATTWGDTTVNLPEGRWRCRLGGHETQGGRQAVEPLLQAFPVGLYVRETAA